MKQTVIILAATAMLLGACHSGTQTEKNSTVYNETVTLEGDSTVYGLACDGCTDSLLVYLPFSGGDPDTIDILNARVQRKVFGRPEVGDEVAFVLNASNKKVADLVINIDRLKGSWCYQVMPKLRRRLRASADSVVQLPPDFPDSLKKKWFQPREYGLELQRDNIVRPIGTQTRGKEQQGPVEYPEMKRYREWHIYNGHLLLMETRRDTTGARKTISTDTADIVVMRHDSLLLRFADHEQGYYRK
ncbi:MAG: hypothetical protein K6F74_10170 [Prevotella sp.]|nr:hypothetical protein [Prevotella sp.]